MTRIWCAALMVVAASAHAEPMGPCEGGVCDIDSGERPWVMTDDCHEDHDVVGYQACRRFGQWSRAARDPDVSIAVGASWRHVLAPPVPLMTAAMRGAMLQRYADIPTGDVRFAVEGHGLYGGVELAMGDLSRETYAFGAFVQGGALIGTRLPVSAFELGVELFAGGRSLRLTDNINKTTAPSDRSFVIEARVTAGVWATPWLEVDASAGTGLLDRQEWLSTLDVAFHSRTFAGER